ncbi:hypothetical protein OFN51_34400, partial [Escherichia coli]|nr:hypothetical protein [Escherichia coli]
FRSQLYRAHSRKILSDEKFVGLKTSAEHLSVKLHHFISYLTKSTFQSKPSARDLSNPDQSVEEPQNRYVAEECYLIPEEFVQAWQG